MICPACGHATKVIDSRPTNDSVERKRECLCCGARFATLEHRITLLKRGGPKNDRKT